MVSRHVGHGFSLEDALAVERAAVQQHLCETDVIAGGRYRTPRAAFVLQRLTFRVEDPLSLSSARAFLERTRVAAPLVRGDDECGVLHAEWLPETFGQECG